MKIWASVKRNITKADIAALMVLIALVLFLLYAVRYGLQVSDESFYFTIPHRLLQGDRLIINEWHLTQLAAIFQYLPFRLYYMLTGGTEGIVLYFRYLYVAVKLLFAVYIYLSLRRYQWWAILCSVIFTGYHAFGYMTLNYYNMGMMAALLVCLTLFAKPRVRRFDYMFAGFVLACCVLLEPAAAAIYFIYTFLMLIKMRREKKQKPFLSAYEFILNKNAWIYSTAGILICAVIFLAILLSGGDIKALLFNLPELAGDSEYNYTTGMASIIKWYKIRQYMAATGMIANVLWAAYFVVLLFFRKKIPEKKPSLFALACVIFAFATVSMLISMQKKRYFVLSVQPIVLSIFGIVCYLLSARKNKKMFVFLLFGWTFAFFTDFTSEVSIGVGCIVATTPSVLLFADMIAEMRQMQMQGVARHFAEETGRNRKQSTRKDKDARARAQILCMALAVCVLIAGEGYYYMFARSTQLLERIFITNEQPLNAQAERGPMKGIKTTAAVKTQYDAILRDLDRLQGAEGPLYVANLCPAPYLYADLPYGTYSSFYVEADSHDRLEHYWELHPNAVPQVIYIPFFNTNDYVVNKSAARDKLVYLRSLFPDCQVETGDAGYIVTVAVQK